MAIDMSTVKDIEYNNKHVKKIEDSNGNILWQAPPSEDWHTVWEGSISKTVPDPSSSSWSYSYTNIVNPNLTGSHLVRFYFSAINASASASYGGSTSKAYYADGTSLGSTKPTSPVELTVDFDSTTSSYTKFVGAYGSATRSADSSGTYKNIGIFYDPTNGFRLRTGTSRDTYTWGTVSVSMTITKIEIYY